jgi:hypothetical protein
LETLFPRRELGRSDAKRFEGNLAAGAAYVFSSDLFGSFAALAFGGTIRDPVRLDDPFAFDS